MPVPITFISPTLILLFAFYQANAQSTLISSGARATAMGNSSACLQDEWALFNNVGGLSKIDQPSAAFSYHAYPGFAPFNRMAAAFAFPAGIGAAAAGVLRFGNEHYNEHILSAGYANTFGLASLGLKINYIQLQTEGFKKADAVTISFGGIAQLTPTLQVGAHIVNINQPKINEAENERVPTLLTLGLGFQLSEKLLIISEVEKDLDHDPVLRAGLEYKGHKKFFARTGFNLSPQDVFGGFGFQQKKFNLDYAIQYNSFFGASHQASVTWKLKREK
jgi:hypothetical protein